MQFKFEAGHATPAQSLFDRPGVTTAGLGEIALFSGGVDSLAGALRYLNSNQSPIALVTHQSGQPSATGTQNALVRSLRQRYPGRVEHFTFGCGLSRPRAPEETQRSRFFLYSSIAYALAQAAGLSRICAYENGVTSLNFAKQQDLMNARASRTTHPKTISLLGELLTEVEGATFAIETPFLWKTKTDVMASLADLGGAGLLSSSISCSKTFKASEGSKQCGGCSQCIDRRFAAFASGLEAHDDGSLYGVDFVLDEAQDKEVSAGVTEYIQQACTLEGYSVDEFYAGMPLELAMAVDGLTGLGEKQAVTQLWELTKRHGQQVRRGLQRMHEMAVRRGRTPRTSTLLRAVEDRPYLAAPAAAPAPSPTRTPLEIFVCYSHRDELLCQQLIKHLHPLECSGLVSIWWDRKIAPGDEWSGRIDTHLDSAHIILLLVSSDFNSSPSCKAETERALERHNANRAVVVPVILRHCDWKRLPLGRLQSLPKDGKPVKDKGWATRDQAYTQVALGLRELVEGKEQ